MTSALLAQERQLRAERARQAEIQRMARCVLRELPAGVDPDEICERARERWNLTAEEARQVTREAMDMQDAGIHGGRHLRPQDLMEEEMGNPLAEKIREATRKALEETPDLPRQEMYEKVMSETGAQNKMSGWEVSYFYPLRKELGLNPPRKTRRPPKGKKEAPKKHPARERPKLNRKPLDEVDEVSTTGGEERVALIGELIGGEPWPYFDHMDRIFGRHDSRREAVRASLDATDGVACSPDELRILHRMGQLEAELRELDSALAVICRLRNAA